MCFVHACLLCMWWYLVSIDLNALDHLCLIIHECMCHVCAWLLCIGLLCVSYELPAANYLHALDVMFCTRDCVSFRWFVVRLCAACINWVTWMQTAIQWHASTPNVNVFVDLWIYVHTGLNGMELSWIDINWMYLINYAHIHSLNHECMCFVHACLLCMWWYARFNGFECTWSPMFTFSRVHVSCVRLTVVHWSAVCIIWIACS